MRRTFVVGDVHGCNDELGELLDAAGWTKRDRLVLVGDLVAKGPDSAGVLSRARELGALAVLGNHDAHLLDVVHHGTTKKTHHAEVAKTLSSKDVAWLEALPLWLELPDDDVVVVHAGLVPGVPLAQQERRNLLNLRSFDAKGEPTTRVEGGTPWAARWKGPPHVVFGHDAIRGLQQHRFATGLDTGCVYGHRLTGLWLDERRLVHVKAHRVWHDPRDS
jgi:hypothetical protein